MDTYEVFSLMLALAGLIGLLIYVKKTVDIARATSEHNHIITRPAVTVSLFADKNRPWTLDHIWILVQNHTPIHAKMKILIEYELKEKLEDISVKVTSPFKSGDYDGNQEWNIAAMDEFIGHTNLPKLKNRILLPNETVILNFTIDVSPFDRTEYRANPQRQYTWKSSACEWIPQPVPKR